MRFTEIDAVTIDAYGTLVVVRDPLPNLVAALRRRGIERTEDEIRGAFAAEAAYYRPRAGDGRDEETLSQLRRDCAAVFLDTLAAELDPDEFAPAYVAALQFEVLDGVAGTLERLRAHGLELAVVGNWDISLADRLEELELARFFSVIVPCARKPDPGGLLRAVRGLGVEPSRALHVGDEPADEEAARAAGMRFAAAPLANAL